MQTPLALQHYVIHVIDEMYCVTNFIRSVITDKDIKKCSNYEDYCNIQVVFRKRFNIHTDMTFLTKYFSYLQFISQKNTQFTLENNLIILLKYKGRRKQICDLKKHSPIQFPTSLRVFFLDLKKMKSTVTLCIFVAIFLLDRKYAYAKECKG